MTPPERTARLQPLAEDILRRWDRIGIGVRCAYSPGNPGVIRHYLEAGRWVHAHGLLAEVEVQQRLMAVLLQTARDAALPMYWRRVCLEYTTLPLARLRSLLKSTAPLASHALECAVQAAHDQLSEARRVEDDPGGRA
jgi:hypothetical protein